MPEYFARIIEHGPSIGFLDDCKIPAWIRTGDGRRWDYRRIVVYKNEDSRADELEQLAGGECIVGPGLIYGPSVTS